MIDLGAFTLIESMDSAIPPPLADDTNVIDVLSYGMSAVPIVNELAPFGKSPDDFLYTASTTLPLISFLPITPSPNCISYFSDSAGTTK